jgi:hypothetical protein
MSQRSVHVPAVLALFCLRRTYEALLVVDPSNRTLRTKRSPLQTIVTSVCLDPLLKP